MEGDDLSNSVVDLSTYNLETVRKRIKQESQPQSFCNFYKCKMCMYRTKFSILLKNHMKRHRFTHSSKLFNCTNMIEKFKCSSCDFRTSVFVNFNKHIDVCHKKNIKVKYEKEGSQDNSSVFVNFNWINLLKSYTCDNCDFKTYSQLIYINHYTQCPLNKSTEQPNHQEFLKWHKLIKNGSSDMFKCKKCSFKTSNMALLTSHKKLRHRFRPHYKVKRVTREKKITLHLCPDCNFFGETAMSLKNHILSKHTPDEDILWYICDQCNFKTKWRSNLYHHVRKMHFTKQYKCIYCDYYSKQERLLDAHVAMNHTTFEEIVVPSWDRIVSTTPTGQNRYKCPMFRCNFKCRIEVGLLDHMYWKHPNFESHWLLCKECPYRTLWKEQLTQHLEMKHTMKAIFGCEMCNFKTMKSSVLKTHMNTHKVKKFLQCELCSFKCSDRGEFEEHILGMHVGVESVLCYKCQLCMFKTIEETVLKEHIFEKHINPQSSDWLQCEMCLYKYPEGQDLKKHIYETHIL